MVKVIIKAPILQQRRNVTLLEVLGPSILDKA